MEPDQKKIVGVYGAAPETFVWVAYPLAGQLAFRTPVSAWAVVDDHSVVPIGPWLGGNPKVLVDHLWATDLADLAEAWIDWLPQLPMLPSGTSINNVPVAWYGDRLVIGSVGLGNEVWGPYTLFAELLLSGEELPEHEEPRIEPDGESAILLPPIASMCRITWGESRWLEMEPAPSLILEPAEEDESPPME